MKKQIREDRLIFQGKVVDVQRGLFKVQLDPAGSEVLCKLSGKLQVHKIMVILGDSVAVEVSPMDITRGRIITRNR